MSFEIGDVICQYRQGKKMSQEEFASRIGVTPQAVSKWERGNGLPDVSLLGGICTVLGVSANILLGLDDKVVEDGNPLEEEEIKSNLIAEPLVIEFSETLINLICEGLNTATVHDCRKKLASERGILLPIVRFRDNCGLEKNAYQILSYEKVILSGSTEPDDKAFFSRIMNDIENYCIKNYAEIINTNIVKTLIDNLKTRYPGVVDNIVPEKISYLNVERRLKEILDRGESIKDLIHILEELEGSACDMQNPIF